ncbi:MAG TPA: hypothetical protein P5307_12280, partial [Pirellulaceae bacterium]|nr:hypothetical protein [Pirellulaceae bacterium]
PLSVQIGDAMVVDNESLIIKDDDLFDGEFDLTKTGPTDVADVYLVIPPALTDFRAMGNAALFGVVEKLGGYFGQLSESEVFQTEIPFTDGKTLGEVLNLEEAFNAKVLDKARESAENTESSVVDTAKQIANDVRTAAFKNVQEFAERIGDKVGFKNDDFDGDGKNDPRLQFEMDFSHVEKIPDTSLNFDVELGDIAQFGITESNLGLSAQVDAQFDFIVLLQAPGQSDVDKIADRQADGTIVFRSGKLVSSLNAGGDLMSAVGKDFRITLTNGKSFDVDIDEAIVPITSNIKAKINEVNGDLTNKITFSSKPNLATVTTGMILSIINRTDGQGRTDRFTITNVNAATGELTVDPTPTAGAGSFEWAIDRPPTTLGQIIDRINVAGQAYATEFELAANEDRTGFKLIDKTASATPVGAGKLKVETLGTSKAAVALGIAGTGMVMNAGEPLAILGRPLHGKSLMDNVFIRNLQLDAVANLSATIGQATASLGSVGLTIENATGEATFGAGLAIHDPGPVFDGRVTLMEASKAILDVRTKLSAQKDVAFVKEDGTRNPISPTGTLALTIKGQDTDLQIPAASEDAAGLIAKLNADANFMPLALAKPGVNAGEVVIELKETGVARLTVAQSLALGLDRNGVHYKSVTLKPQFPLSASTTLDMTVSRDDRTTAVNIAFDGTVTYQDIDQLVAGIEAKLAGTTISVGSSGNRLSFHLNNGRAHIVEISPFASLGFTTSNSKYLIRPTIDGSATFDLPFKLPSPIPGIELPAINLPNISLTIPKLTDLKDINIEFPSLDLDFKNKLQSLKKLDFDVILSGLKMGLEYLKSLDVGDLDLPLFNQNIPLLDINLRDSLDIALKFSDFLIEFEANPIGKLNELADRIRLGLGAKAVTFSYDPGDIPGLIGKRPALRLDIAYATPAFEKELPLDIDLSSIEAIKALGGIDRFDTGEIDIE